MDSRDLDVAAPIDTYKIIEEMIGLRILHDDRICDGNLPVGPVYGYTITTINATTCHDFCRDSLS